MLKIILKDYNLGIGDWGLGPIPNPNPQINNINIDNILLINNKKKLK